MGSWLVNHALWVRVAVLTSFLLAGLIAACESPSQAPPSPDAGDLSSAASAATLRFEITIENDGPNSIDLLTGGRSCVAFELLLPLFGNIAPTFSCRPFTPEDPGTCDVTPMAEITQVPADGTHLFIAEIPLAQLYADPSNPTLVHF